MSEKQTYQYCKDSAHGPCDEPLRLCGGPSQQNNPRGFWKTHTDSTGMPTSELELQRMLNEEGIAATYLLSDLPGMNAEEARRVVISELDKDFANALAHIREARRLFPSDGLFSQQELQVIAELRLQPIMATPTSTSAKRRSILAGLIIKGRVKGSDRRLATSKERSPPRGALTSRTTTGS
eukprot:RCo047495